IRFNAYVRVHRSDFIPFDATAHYEDTLRVAGANVVVVTRNSSLDIPLEAEAFNWFIYGGVSAFLAQVAETGLHAVLPTIPSIGDKVAKAFIPTFMVAGGQKIILPYTGVRFSAAREIVAHGDVVPRTVARTPAAQLDGPYEVPAAGGIIDLPVGADATIGVVCGTYDLRDPVHVTWSTTSTIQVLSNDNSRNATFFATSPAPTGKRFVHGGTVFATVTDVDNLSAAARLDLTFVDEHVPPKHGGVPS
ncbi:MAG TPA: hypothetical protein VH352_00345, partial [Pseudonocardiaceae bacterium]|nr:hypothetical protein [Pseudonocardiaceae bacterium]